MAESAHRRNKSDSSGLSGASIDTDTSNDEAIARALQQSPQGISISASNIEADKSLKPRERKGNSRSTTSSPVSPRKPLRGGPTKETQGDKPTSLRAGSRFFSKKASQMHRRSRSSGDSKELTGSTEKSSTKQDATPVQATSTYIRLRGRFDDWRDQLRTAAVSSSESSTTRKISLGGPDDDNTIGGPTLLTTRSLGPLLARLGIPKVAATEMTALLRAFLAQWEALCRQPTVDVDAMSQCVLSLYGLVEDKTRYKSTAWAAVDSALTDTAIELFERHVMELLYDLVFAADEADESKDLLLQEKIRKLRWVRAEHLHAKCDPDDPVVRKAFENAQDNLILMDSQRAPLDKLHRVVTASKTIFDLLSKGGSGSAVGADDFMPVLIYAIIKANPPMLYSNLQYVTRFCNPDKLNSGEAGYFYTNLYGAVEFITHMDAESLQMSPIEFDRQMQQNDFYKPAPTLKNHESLLESLERLAALSARQDRVRADLEKLNEEMNGVLNGNVPPVATAESAAETEITSDVAPASTPSETPGVADTATLASPSAGVPKPTPNGTSCTAHDGHDANSPNYTGAASEPPAEREEDTSATTDEDSKPAPGDESGNTGGNDTSSTDHVKDAEQFVSVLPSSSAVVSADKADVVAVDAETTEGAAGVASDNDTSGNATSAADNPVDVAASEPPSAISAVSSPPATGDDKAHPSDPGLTESGDSQRDGGTGFGNAGMLDANHDLDANDGVPVSTPEGRIQESTDA
eukprot:m.538907 g.538907  ORF g.538907 m.538907 type:complete len:749 (+) comp22086_c0_seq4:193-2439(+)